MSASFFAIVPAFNEGPRIGKLLDDLIPEVEGVVVIDDGSIDNTYEEAQKREVHLIKHEKNKGKGKAIQTGIKHFLTTDMDVAIFIDADGQHYPKDIEKFRRVFAKNPDIDVVTASRFGTAQWVDNMPFLRKFSNLMSRFGIWALYNGFIVEDPQNGYRAYNRESLKYIRFDSSRYEAETEILIDGYMKGFRFAHVHIESVYLDENTSKFSLFKDTWTIPGIMVKYFFKKKPFLYRNREKRLQLRKQ